MKPLFCLVCGVNIGTRYLSKGNLLTAELCTLTDGKKASQLLEEISKISLKPKDLVDKSFCQKCLKKCQDYYDKQKDLKTLEDEIMMDFKNTNIVKINAINTEISKNGMATISPETSLILKTKQEKVATSNRSLLKSLNRPSNQSLLSSAASSQIEGSSIASEENCKRNVANIKKSVMTIDINSLPKGFIERFGSSKHIIIDNDLDIETTSGNVQQNNEVTNYKYSTILVQNDTIEENPSQNDMEAGSEDEMETEYLLGDVEILDENGDEDDNDDSETILMSDSGLLQMVKGTSNKFITLLNDNQDSNDESQIELQVSGDEDTANAIIAAAQQQGCAFIKVNSGEVIRVKSPPGSEHGDDGLSEDTLTITDELQQIMTYHEKKYHCQLCKNRDEPGEFSTSNAKKMMDHMNTEHDSRVYICSMCQFVAKRRTDYTQHLATSHNSKNSSANQKKHECPDCDKRFSTKFLLDQHSYLHKGGRPFECSICNKSFTSKYVLQSHFKTHMKRERSFNCPMCHKSFYTINNLNQHEKTHTDKREYKCNSCDKMFLTRHNLEIHSVVHTKVKPFVCGVCDKAFARKPEIRDHMRTHTGERPFVCSLCPAAFSQRSNLHSHKRNTHTQEKRYACNLCDKRFKRRRLLEYHSRAAHTGERPHACAQCGACFVYPEHLRKHARTHTDHRPHHCEICGKKFSSADNRNTHRFIHSDKKPYECLVCGAGFMRKSLLYTHMTTSGHITESIVVNQPRVSQIGDVTDVPVAESTETNNQETATSQAVLENMPTLESDNVYVGTGADQGNALYITNGDENNSFCLTTTDVQKYVTNEEGSYVRLVQVKLPDGGEGWIALEEITE